MPFLYSGYQLQVYHIDGDIPPPNSVQQPPAVSWYGTAPRSGKHHHNHHKHSHHSHGSSSGHSKASRSHSSGNVVEDKKLSPVKKVPSQQQQQPKVQQTHKPKLNLQKSYSDGELLEDEPSKPPTSTKVIDFKYFSNLLTFQIFPPKYQHRKYYVTSHTYFVISVL